MLFTELRFLLFFLLLFAVYWGLRGRGARKLLLLGASYAFYAAFDLRFLALLWVATLVDFTVGLGLGRTDSRRRRRLILAASLLTNLGMLSYFKYAGFFVDSAARLLEAMGLEPSLPTLEIVLPVGISFYTFQTLSYTIDVYRRKLEPTRSLLDLSLFVGFFPHLGAGPILRASEFLPQTRIDHRFRDVAVRTSLTLLLLGYVQKAVLADNVAPIVDRYYADPSAYGAAAAWLASLLFWVQVYGDFAGYSCMALGLAGLLGYSLPRNFDYAFLSRNVSEFWSRWHMTLSAWINDYVLAPLRRPGQSWARYCANIMIAMTLFGFWHGASWKFVLWGALNGVAVVVYRTARRYGRGHVSIGRGPLVAVAGAAATIATVTITNPLFRADSDATAFDVIASMLLLGPDGGRDLAGFGGRVGEPGLAVLLVALLALHWLVRRVSRVALPEKVPAPVFAAAYGAAIPLAFALSASALQPFIYFRF